MTFAIWLLLILSITILFSINLKGVGSISAVVLILIIFFCIIVIKEDLNSFQKIYDFFKVNK